MDGKSLSDEEKAAAAVKAKEKEDRINSLYNKYNEDAQDPFFNIESSNKAVSEARNKTLEEKQKWLDANIIDEEEGIKARQFLKDNPGLSSGNKLDKYNPGNYIARWIETSIGFRRRGFAFRNDERR